MSCPVISLDISKVDLIVQIGRALMQAGRTTDAVAFYRAASLARDAQEVLTLIPADIEVRFA